MTDPTTRDPTTRPEMTEEQIRNHRATLGRMAAREAARVARGDRHANVTEFLTLIRVCSGICDALLGGEAGGTKDDADEALGASSAGSTAVPPSAPPPIPRISYAAGLERIARYAELVAHQRIELAEHCVDDEAKAVWYAKATEAESDIALCRQLAAHLLEAERIEERANTFGENWLANRDLIAALAAGYRGPTAEGVE